MVYFEICIIDLSKFKAVYYIHSPCVKECIYIYKYKKFIYIHNGVGAHKFLDFKEKDQFFLLWLFSLV